MTGSARAFTCFHSRYCERVGPCVELKARARFFSTRTTPPGARISFMYPTRSRVFADCETAGGSDIWIAAASPSRGTRNWHGSPRSPSRRRGTDVWIAADPASHIQATGRDQKGRKQYRYHPEWTACRDEAKFSTLAAFGQNLPRLRAAGRPPTCGKRKLARERVRGQRRPASSTTR